MKAFLRSVIAMFALLAGVGIATSEETNSNKMNNALNLTISQQHRIFHHVKEQNIRQDAPRNFTAAVGETVPKSFILYPLAYSVTWNIPAFGNDRYVLLQDNEVLIVDPRTNKIVAIITQ